MGRWATFVNDLVDEVRSCDTSDQERVSLIARRASAVLEKGRKEPQGCWKEMWQYDVPQALLGFPIDDSEKERVVKALLDRITMEGADAPAGFVNALNSTFAPTRLCEPVLEFLSQLGRSDSELLIRVTLGVLSWQASARGHKFV